MIILCYTKDKTGVELLKAPGRQKTYSSDTRSGSVITAIILFAGVIALAFFTYQKSINPQAEPYEVFKNMAGKSVDTVKEAQVLYSFSFESRDKPVFEIYGDYIAKCSSAGILFFDKKGDVVWSEGITYKNPILKTNGKELLVADTGGHDICVIRDRSVLWKDRLDVSVLNADISEDGYVTVVTSSKRDNNEIRVYNPRGLELFRKVIANDFAVSAHISPSEEYLAVSCINTNSTGAYSRLKLYDMQGNDVAEKSFDETGELLPIIEYGRDDIIFAVGDRTAACLDMSGNIKWEGRFNDVLGADVISGRQFAIAVDDGEGIVLKFFSRDGNELFTCPLREKPEGVVAAGNRIALYTERSIQLYSGKGEETGRYESSSPIKQVAFFNGKQCCVITGNTVTIINFV